MSDLNFEAAKKERRERMRWFILRTLWVAGHEGMYLPSIRDVLTTVYHDVTELEIKRELDYLAEQRDLVKLKIDPMERWFAKIDRYGSDIVEYAVECEPGIARPRFGI